MNLTIGLNDTLTDWHLSLLRVEWTNRVKYPTRLCIGCESETYEKYISNKGSRRNTWSVRWIGQQSGQVEIECRGDDNPEVRWNMF